MRKRILLKCLAGILICACAACPLDGAMAEKLALPDELLSIAEDAFAGDTSLTEVIIPAGVTSLGARAFAGCAALGWVIVPAGVEAIGDAAFAGCAEDLLLRTTPDSAAYRLARANQIDYQADTTYRALLIGQTYPTRWDMRLNGPDNDISAMRACLAGFSDTPYQVTARKNLTAEGILSAVSDVLGSAGAQDVSLFYYSGHGVYSDDAAQMGALLGADGDTFVTVEQLRAALDGIAGRKIIIIDACYSGNFIPASARTSRSLRTAAASARTFTHEDFTAAFISAFSQRKKRSGTAAGEYFILAAAAADEESYEDQVGSKVYGLFTSNLCAGCGYSCATAARGTMHADSNGNRVLTLEEVFQYAHGKLIADGQHAQVYPSGCRWFGIFRETPAP